MFRIIYISGYFLLIYLDNEYNIIILRNGTDGVITLRGHELKFHDNCVLKSKFDIVKCSVLDLKLIFLNSLPS